ncbi:hypothetical protein [Kaarinaea lacus]
MPIQFFQRAKQGAASCLKTIVGPRRDATTPNFEANYSLGGLTYALQYSHPAIGGGGILLKPPQGVFSLCLDSEIYWIAVVGLSLFEPLSIDVGLRVADLLRVSRRVLTHRLF